LSLIYGEYSTIISNRFFGTIKAMRDFFRKRKLVAKLRKLIEKAEASEFEEQTGLDPYIPEDVFLGSMVEKYWFGIPYCFRGEEWAKKKKGKDRALVKELFRETPPPIDRITRGTYNADVIKNTGYDKDKLSNSEEPDNRIMVRVQRPSYSNWSNTFERFAREYIKTYQIIGLVIIAILGSDYLAKIKDYLLILIHKIFLSA